MNKKTLIQLGCGPLVKNTDWIDFDGSWNVAINHYPDFIKWIFKNINKIRDKNAYEFPQHVQYLNLHKKFPFKDNSVDAFYASHVWEHLYEEDGKFALQECFRACKPGGYVRLVVPDLFYYCSEYISSCREDRAKILNNKLMYRDAGRNKCILSKLYNAITDFHTHKFMYDSKLLTELFRKCGFIEIRECKLNESNIEFLNQIESPHRVGTGVGIAVEGQKPK